MNKEFMQSVKFNLEVNNLSYTFEDGTRALKGVSFSVDKGETIAIMGHNGAGKSTLLWLLMGAFKGFSGEINICGSNINELNGCGLYKTINLVFQNPENQIFCDTVADEISFAPDNFGIDAKTSNINLEEIAAALGILRLLKKEPQHLSFGQKKRVALASILIIKPEILLLDEPSSNLDFLSKEKLVAAVNKFKGSKIIVTQDICFALSVSTRLIYMNDGSISYDGPFKSDDFKLKCPDLFREIIRYREMIAGI